MAGFWGFLKAPVNKFCYNRETWLIGTSICWPSHGNYLEWPQQLHITIYAWYHTVVQLIFFGHVCRAE